jgi:hypothetical protein
MPFTAALTDIRARLAAGQDRTAAITAVCLDRNIPDGYYRERLSELA